MRIDGRRVRDLRIRLGFVSAQSFYAQVFEYFEPPDPSATRGIGKSNGRELTDISTGYELGLECRLRLVEFLRERFGHQWSSGKPKSLEFENRFSSAFTALRRQACISESTLTKIEAWDPEKHGIPPTRKSGTVQALAVALGVEPSRIEFRAPVDVACVSDEAVESSHPAPAGTLRWESVEAFAAVMVGSLITCCIGVIVKLLIN